MLRIPINEQGWGLFLQLLHTFRQSKWGKQALFLAASLIMLLFIVNGLNVLNSYVGRDFMSALAERNSHSFIQQAIFYILVFAASTVVAVVLRYGEERLALLWRECMTHRFIELYLRYPTYYRMNDELIRSTGIEHPDQRIADDVRTFTITTLSFALMTLNGAFTVVAFSGVLWSISPWLFGVALGYAVAGSYCTVKLGAPLVDLNYTQLDKEAAFRSGLIHVREKAESVALLHREASLLSRLMGHFDEVAANLSKIILVNRNLGFFTTGYNWLVQIIPVLLVGPLYLRGEVEFGVVTQSAMAFAMLVGAFSLIVTQFQSISSFAAVIQRLVNLWYAIELAQSETVSGLDIREEDDHLVYENLTLRSPSDKRVLIRELNLTIPYGMRVLVTSVDEVAKEALFRATAGIYDAGIGCVKRPPLDRILFLPERPYLPPGTLRQVLTSAMRETMDSPIHDETILTTLKLLNLSEVLTRSGGLDTEHDWDTLLSLHEQRLIAFVRILLASPRFAVLYSPARELDNQTAEQMACLLRERNITCLTFGRLGYREGEDHPEHYDAVLEIKVDGLWDWCKAGD